MTAGTWERAQEWERGRHLPEGKLSAGVSRLRPAIFAQCALLALVGALIWPASLGGAFGVVTIAGHSMEPTYDLGDVVVTWKEPLEVGDVILFRVPAGEPGEGNPVIHRVVGSGPGGWETQGDNMALPDTWRPTDSDILGVAKFQIPFDARYLALLRSWWFVSGAAGLAVALMLWPGETEDHPRARGRHRAQRRGVSL